MSKRQLLALALLGAFALSMVGTIGCGQRGIRTYPIQGTLKYRGTEETVSGARVEMRPVDPIDKQHRVTTVGIVQDDGAIEFTTFQPGDGAIEGKHQVILREPPMPRGWDFDERGGPPPPKIPRKYKSYSSSGLTLDVTPGGENRLDIQIERPESK